MIAAIYLAHRSFNTFGCSGLHNFAFVPAA
jgi:hypothetical protein